MLNAVKGPLKSFSSAARDPLLSILKHVLKDILSKYRSSIKSCQWVKVLHLEFKG